MFQDKKSPRGSVEITPNSFIVNLFERANTTTLLHETAHIFLEEFRAVAEMADANESAVKDFETIKKWLKFDGGEFTTLQHETFARGFETYLMEGKAPDVALERAFERFKKWLTQIYREVRALNAPINDDVRRVFDRIAGSLMSIAVEEAQDSEVSRRDLLRELSSIETLDGIRSWLVETSTGIARCIEENRAKSIGAAAERVAAYIERNFDNQNISLTDIGDAVGLSPSYVSRIFKERYGMNYVDCLNGHRIETAKKLLKETNCSVGDIGTRTGFSNIQTFTRVFKKHEKITPGQYRSGGDQAEADL